MAHIHYLHDINESFFKLENPEEKPKFLYKTMPLEYFLKTPKKGLWFAKPDTWEDPFEKRFYSADHFTSNGSEIKNPFNNQFLCCCMTSIALSEAHWNIYSRDQIGIQLKINREKFLSFLINLSPNFHFYIGNVKYQTQQIIEGPLSKNDFLGEKFDYRKNEDLAKLLLIKRNAFEYEDEIRFIMMDKKRRSFESNGTALNSKKNKFIDTIDAIKIAPKCPKEIASLLKKHFHEILPKSITVTQNHLYDDRASKSKIII